MPTEYLLLPISDAAPNQLSPVPGGDHFARVADDNGDTAYLSITDVGFQEFFGLTDALTLPDELISNFLILRMKARLGNADTLLQIRQGLRRKTTMVTYWGLSWLLSGSTLYQTLTDTWTVDPEAPTQTWTKQRIAGYEMAFEVSTYDQTIPRPRLTYQVAIWNVDPKPAKRYAAAPGASSTTKHASGSPRKDYTASAVPVFRATTVPRIVKQYVATPEAADYTAEGE